MKYSDRSKISKKKKEEYITKRTKGKCQACSEEFPVELFDFHHIDPLSKKMSLGQNKWEAQTVSKKVLDEAEKCYILCSNCHRLEHIAMKRSESIVNDKETYSRYRNHHFSNRQDLDGGYIGLRHRRGKDIHLPDQQRGDTGMFESVRRNNRSQFYRLRRSNLNKARKSIIRWFTGN